MINRKTAARVKIMTFNEQTLRIIEQAAAELRTTEEEAITAIICDWAASQGLIQDYGLEEDTPTLGQA